MTSAVEQPGVTLGELLGRVEGSEEAHAANMRRLQEIEKRSPFEAIHYHASMQALRFRPDDATMPGVGRLEAFADRQWGSGLKPESIRRIRGIVCERLGIDVSAADKLTLQEAADILFGPQVTSGGDRSPRERSASYLAEVYAVEDGWARRNGGLTGFAIGMSPWLGRIAQLEEIKRRHGFVADHPLVWSVTAYLKECESVQAERSAQLGDKPPAGAPEGDQFQSWARRQMEFDFRVTNCQGRHFPRLDHNGSNIRTPADLWGFIHFVLAPVRTFSHRGPRERPPVCPQDVERMYGTMRRLGVPGTPNPPYPSFTPAEAEDELERIATELERHDRQRYEEVLAQEESTMAVANVVPTLGDLIDYHQAVADDPKNKGNGLLRMPVMGPAGVPDTVIRVSNDKLKPTARSLENAEIRYQVEDAASQHGFCQIGDFSARAAEAIKARLIVSRRIEPADADAMPLTDLLAFLFEQPATNTTELTDSDNWLTVTQAARIAGAPAWQITRAADGGKLKTNGKSRTERRIDKAGLCDWILKRAEHPDSEETNAQVEALLRRTGQK